MFVSVVVTDVGHIANHQILQIWRDVVGKVLNTKLIYILD